VCGAISFFGLPNSLETASFLTQEEKEFGRERLLLDNPKTPDGYETHSLSSVTQLTLHRTLAAEEEAFRWSEVRRGILEPQVWFSATAYFAILSGIYSFGLFVRHKSSSPMPLHLLQENHLTLNSSQQSSKTSASPKTPTKSNYGPSSPTPSQP
jgi:hypothetical protein